MPVLIAPPSARAVAAPALEEAFSLARAAARGAADPSSVLRDDSASAEAKLDALDALHDRIPNQKPPAQAASLDAIAAAAADARQPPEVRARALTLLGYAVPPVVDEAARTRAFAVLLAALPDPSLRLFVLRGLGPASHGLPRPLEPAFLNALLGALDGPVAGEERQTAFLTLYAFVSSNEDLAKRAPALAALIDARVLAPIEADPAAFVRDPRATPAARELAVAAVWIAARQRQAAGAPAAAARVKALLPRLIAAETDAGARAWYATYRDAAPPAPARRDKTTSLPPLGPDEP